MTIIRVEVTPKQGDGMRDVRGDVVRRQLKADHGIDVTEVRSITGFLIKSSVSSSEVSARVDDLFSDPIIEDAVTDALFLTSTQHFSNVPDAAITVGFKPGVTDNPGSAAYDGFKTLFPQPEPLDDASISTYQTYIFYGLPEGTSAEWLASTLHNNLIQRAVVSDVEACTQSQWPAIDFPEKPPQTFTPPQAMDLEVSDEELINMSESGLLALNLEEMQTIQSHYRDADVQSSRAAVGIVGNAPTDVELECLAQTWSEHCKHKIFASKIHHIDPETGEDSIIDSIFKTHIMKPTHDMQKEVDWLLSVFHDNSGVIAWDENWSVCMKA